MPFSLLIAVAVKLLMIEMIRTHENENETSNTAETVRDTIYALTEAMRGYFLPARFYSRYYPYINFRSAMVRKGLGLFWGFAPFC